MAVTQNEEVYLKDYASVTEARQGIERYLRFYNHERLHQSLDYQAPAALYKSGGRSRFKRRNGDGFIC